MAEEQNRKMEFSGYSDVRSRESETPNFDRYGGSNIGPKIMDQSDVVSEVLSQITYGAKP